MKSAALTREFEPCSTLVQQLVGELGKIPLSLHRKDASLLRGFRKLGQPQRPRNLRADVGRSIQRIGIVIAKPLGPARSQARPHIWVWTLDPPKELLPNLEEVPVGHQSICQ